VNKPNLKYTQKKKKKKKTLMFECYNLVDLMESRGVIF
jgi:hypothetical protein